MTLPAEVPVLVSAAWGVLAVLACLVYIHSDFDASFLWWGTNVRVWGGRSKCWNALHLATAGGFWSLLALTLTMKYVIEARLPSAVFGTLQRSSCRCP